MSVLSAGLILTAALAFLSLITTTTMIASTIGAIGVGCGLVSVGLFRMTHVPQNATTPGPTYNP